MNELKQLYNKEFVSPDYVFTAIHNLSAVKFCQFLESDSIDYPEAEDALRKYAIEHAFHNLWKKLTVGIETVVMLDKETYHKFFARLPFREKRLIVNIADLDFPSINVSLIVLLSIMIIRNINRRIKVMAWWPEALKFADGWAMFSNEELYHPAMIEPPIVLLAEGSTAVAKKLAERHLSNEDNSAELWSILRNFSIPLEQLYYLDEVTEMEKRNFENASVNLTLVREWKKWNKPFIQWCPDADFYFSLQRYSSFPGVFLPLIEKLVAADGGSPVSRAKYLIYQRCPKHEEVTELHPAIQNRFTSGHPNIFLLNPNNFDQSQLRHYAKLLLNQSSFIKNNGLQSEYFKAWLEEEINCYPAASFAVRKYLINLVKTSSIWQVSAVTTKVETSGKSGPKLSNERNAGPSSH